MNIFFPQCVKYLFINFFALIILMSILYTNSAFSASLNLPSLPSTCSIIQNDMSILEGTWQIDAFATPGTSISGNSAEILKIGIKCTSLQSALSLSIKADNSGQWITGRDVQDTGIKGVGLRIDVTALPESDNVVCTGNEIAGAGTNCVMKSSSNESSVTLTLKAKLEKTDGSTPSFYSGIIPNNLGYIVALGNTEVPVHDWVHPVISTITNCRISGSSAKSIDFGTVSLSGITKKEGFNRLKISDPVTFQVECLPSDDNAKRVDTKMQISGISGISDNLYLKTNRDDIQIALLSSDNLSGKVAIEPGIPYKMTYTGNDDGHLTYSSNVQAELMYN
ncbi:hypothetical protein BIW58_24670, partial [Salmonella enterica]|nr:hypothetical protein [Salmonella enterica]